MILGGLLSKLYVASPWMDAYVADNVRLQWFLDEVQYFAYFEPDSGGVPDVASWCEREWNRVLSVDPHHVGALTGSYHLPSPDH